MLKRVPAGLIVAVLTLSSATARTDSASQRSEASYRAGTDSAMHYLAAYAGAT